MILKENTKDKVNSAADVAKIIAAMLATEDEISRDREHLYVFGLTAKNSIRFIDLCSLGTMTGSLVHPREVFRLAVNRGVVSIIVAHNHPSGDPAPSKDDIAVSERLKNAGDILGIALLDHVIVGSDGQYHSLKEQGII